jgi:hypothetical protein
VRGGLAVFSKENRLQTELIPCKETPHADRHRAVAGKQTLQSAFRTDGQMCLAVIDRV